MKFGHFGTLITRHRLTASALMSDAQSSVTRYMRPVLWAGASESIRDVAQKMTDAEQSYALIESQSGVGLVTDRDFRSKVGRGQFDIDSPVHQMMSYPLITVSNKVTLASAFLQMVERGVHHCCR